MSQTQAPERESDSEKFVHPGQDHTYTQARLRQKAQNNRRNRSATAANRRWHHRTVSYPGSRIPEIGYHTYKFLPHVKADDQHFLCTPWAG